MAPKTDVIEQLRARIAELEEEIERLRADNIAFARNLKGKSATTGATYEHICAQLAAAQGEIANETAEACAKACEDVIGNTPHDQRMLAAIDCAVMLRSGAWKEFKRS